MILSDFPPDRAAKWSKARHPPNPSYLREGPLKKYRQIIDLLHDGYIQT